MHLTVLVLSLFLYSCATRYVLPGNRFMTPETNGGFLRGQVELQQTNANQLRAKTAQGTVNQGVAYSDLARTSYLVSSSFFEQVDLFWAHTGAANSLAGVKVQLLGTPRVNNGIGHKLALSAALGENAHEPEDKSIDFTLGGREFGLLYGYRINPTLLPYSSLMYSSYNFEGDIKKGANAGLKPEYGTTILAANLGLQIDFQLLFGKLECTYQKLATDNTKDRGRFIFGYSIGLSW
jgi:hypothetical protein